MPPSTEEDEAEKLRLFYVALTRARRQIFVPLNFKKRASNYERSIGELFFSRLFPEPSYEKVRDLGFQVVEASGHQTHELPESPPPPKMIPPPELPPLPQLKELLSFTSLKSHTKSERGAINCEPDDLPPGAKTGLFLHEIFEKISLKALKEAHSPADLHPLIAPFVKNSPWEKWHEKVSERIFKAFNTLFEGLDFTLKEVDENHSYREMEFLHAQGNGFMKGVIDWILCMRAAPT